MTGRDLTGIGADAEDADIRRILGVGMRGLRRRSRGPDGIEVGILRCRFG